MGGDRAPGMVLKGAEIALQRHPEMPFMLFGEEDRRPPAAGEAAAPRQGGDACITRARWCWTTPSRRWRFAPGGDPACGWRSTRSPKGSADGVVSAGNTGALMAMAKFVLKTLPGIDRPAIATFFPTRRGESVMLDLGANVECDAENLVQFALMGDVFARTVLGLVEPTVGLLNVGSEDLKGNDAVRARQPRLRGALTPIRFYGFVEGDDIAAGTVDVVVTDGFTGNVALKTAEGTAKLFSELLASAFHHSLMARIGYLFARGR